VADLKVGEFMGVPLKVVPRWKLALLRLRYPRDWFVQRGDRVYLIREVRSAGKRHAGGVMGIDRVRRADWQWGLHEYTLCWRFCLGPIEFVFDKRTP
jgi:hypothetical protein